MKKKILMMMALVLFFGTTTIAQEEHDNAIPENGFWEVITSAGNPRSATVRFYDLQMHLVYEEKMEGVKLKIEQERTRKALNATLKVAVAAWQEHQRLARDIGLVAALIKR